MSPVDVQLAKDHAEFYRLRGYAVLPGHMEHKRPACRFKEFWESHPPASLFDEFPTTNLHLVCGRRWRLLVIDLDGPEAQQVWPTMGFCPKTWISHSGGAGRHIWFTIPRDYPKEIKFGMLWKGSEPHSRIDRLCDHSLVIVPPSIHVTTGKRYQFEQYSDPTTIPMPAFVPNWVLNLKPIPMERIVKPVVLPMPRLPLALDGILDKVGLARSWGLRIVGSRPDQGGWIGCRSIEREDARPSCSLNVNSGVYYDHSSGLSLSFIDIAVALKAFPDRQTAIEGLRKLA